MQPLTIGSICSGIEGASVAWQPLDFHFQWFSEIEAFPSTLLKERYPNVVNVGDMKGIVKQLQQGELAPPDLICGGTPCQAFSLAGKKEGLHDDRGNLTMTFVDIIETNDRLRKEKQLEPTVVLWENVEGVLTDKTNAFGCFLGALAGYSNPLQQTKWASAGVIYGPSRNIAWRVVDAKFFGLPQQRKRLYVLAGGKDFYPETVLFELGETPSSTYPTYPLTFEKEGQHFEVFRSYTDCLYAAYGTKWNGNAAAYNGSLFVVQNERIRRLSPLEAERLMGFPDHYTHLPTSNLTQRYRALGNSWSIPVIRWFGKRIQSHRQTPRDERKPFVWEKEQAVFTFPKGQGVLVNGTPVNCSKQPNESQFSSLYSIVDLNPPEQLYLTAKGCAGILRRYHERQLTTNPRLVEILSRTKPLHD